MDEAIVRTSLDAAAERLTVVSSALSEAQTHIAAARAALPPRVVVIGTPAAFDQALAAASPGDTLLLSSTLVYPSPLVLPKPITLLAETYEARRGELMMVDEPAPRFLAGVTALGDDVHLKGVEARHVDPMRTIVTIGGARSSLDRWRVLGDPLTGGKRAVNFRGGQGVMRFGYVDDIFLPGTDTQAIYSQEMLPGGGLAIEFCYLRAAGEVVMFGGGDSSAPEAMPSNVTMSDVVFDKRPEWLPMVGPGKHVQQIKNGLEFKACRGFRGTRLQFKRCAGVSAGQGGYTLVFTPRNQGGKAPWSSVQDIVIDGFTIDGGSGIATFLGTDNNAPSGPLADVTLRNGVVTGLDRLAFGTSATGRLFAFERAPRNITLDTIAATGVNVKAYGYFSSLQPPTGLTIANMNLPKPTAYTWKLDGDTHPAGVSWPANVRAALLAYMPDAQLDGTVA